MNVAEAMHVAVHDALRDSAQTALQALIGRRVYDRTPDALPPYPYLTFDMSVDDDSNTCARAWVVTVEVHIWSDSVGTRKVKQVGGLISDLLAPFDIDDVVDVDGFQIIVASVNAEYRQEAPLTEGILTFTFQVDETGD